MQKNCHWVVSNVSISAVVYSLFVVAPIVWGGGGSVRTLFSFAVPCVLSSFGRESWLFTIVVF